MARADHSPAESSKIRCDHLLDTFESLLWPQAITHYVVCDVVVDILKTYDQFHIQNISS